MKAAPSELDQLAREAAAADQGIVLDAQAPGAGDAPDPGPAVDPATAWAQFPALFGKLVSPAMPELAGVYSEQACMEWGRAMVPLAQKYGWTPGEFMEWLGPWAGAAMATWPLAWPTVQAIRARREKAAAPDAANERSDARPAPSNVVNMHQDATDPDLRDPTQTNRPPRPV